MSQTGDDSIIESGNTVVVLLQLVLVRTLRDRTEGVCVYYTWTPWTVVEVMVVERVEQCRRN